MSNTTLTTLSAARKNISCLAREGYAYFTYFLEIFS